MAFLRIVRWHIDPSKYDELQAMIASNAGAFEAAAPGLQRRYVAYDPATGDGLISVVFATREQAEAGIPVPDEYRAKVGGLGRAVQSVAVMEIRSEFVGSTPGAAGFLRVVRTHLDPSKFYELVGIVGQTVAEREAATPGLQCRYVARDPSTGNGLISLVTETRAQAEVGINRLPDELYAKMDALGWTVEPPVVMEITHSFVKEKAPV
jgi:hypothetical protein